MADYVKHKSQRNIGILLYGSVHEAAGEEKVEICDRTPIRSQEDPAPAFSARGIWYLMRIFAVWRY